MADPFIFNSCSGQKLKVLPHKKPKDLEKAMLEVVRSVFPQKPKAKAPGDSAVDTIFIEPYPSDIALMLIHPTIRENLQTFIQKIVLHPDRIAVSAESSRRLSEELAYLVGKDVNEKKMSAEVGAQLLEQLTQDALVFKIERDPEGIRQGIVDAYSSGKEGKDPKFSFSGPRCGPRLAALPAWTPVG